MDKFLALNELTDYLNPHDSPDCLNSHQHFPSLLSLIDIERSISFKLAIHLY